MRKVKSFIVQHFERILVLIILAAAILGTSSSMTKRYF